MTLRNPGSQTTAPPSEHPGNTSRGGGGGRAGCRKPVSSCGGLTSLAAQPTGQTKLLLPHLPAPPTRVLNSKNSQNIQMVTYEMLPCIFLSQR